MYCTSQEFLTEMRKYIDEIEKQSNGKVVFEEYICLPYYGNTVLRFNMKDDQYTLEDLDHYEALMQKIVKARYLVDFMGEVYRHVGLDVTTFEERFLRCNAKYPDVVMTKADDQEKLEEDSRSLLQECGLSLEQKVWEIQLDEEMVLLILGMQNEKIGTYSAMNTTVHVFTVDEKSCSGLMKAIMTAKEKQVSLPRILLEA